MIDNKELLLVAQGYVLGLDRFEIAAALKTTPHTISHLTNEVRRAVTASNSAVNTDIPARLPAREFLALVPSESIPALADFPNPPVVGAAIPFGWKLSLDGQRLERDTQEQATIETFSRAFDLGPQAVQEALVGCWGNRPVPPRFESYLRLNASTIQRACFKRARQQLPALPSPEPGRVDGDAMKQPPKDADSARAVAPTDKHMLRPEKDKRSTSIMKDVKRIQAEQQPAVVMQVLRLRRDELTFADIRTLLASPLGEGLAGIQIRVLFNGEAGATESADQIRPAKSTKVPCRSMKALASWMRGQHLSADVVARRSGHDISHVRRLFEPDGPNPTLRVVLDLAEAAGTQFTGVKSNSVPAALEWLDELRRIGGLSIAELAVRTGMKRPHLSRIFNGKQPGITLEVFETLVSTLGADMELVPRTRPSAAANTSEGSPSPSGRRKRKARHSHKPQSRAAARSPKVSALTRDGRRSYDNSIVDVLRKKGGFHTPREIRATAGGTESQFGSAIHRLIAAGRVEQAGRFASAKYAAKTAAT